MPTRASSCQRVRALGCARPHASSGRKRRVFFAAFGVGRVCCRELCVRAPAALSHFLSFFGSPAELPWVGPWVLERLYIYTRCADENKHLSFDEPCLHTTVLIFSVSGAVLGAEGPAPGDRVHLQPGRLRPGGEAGSAVYGTVASRPITNESFSTLVFVTVASSFSPPGGQTGSALCCNLSPSHQHLFLFLFLRSVTNEGEAGRSKITIGL